MFNGQKNFLRENCIMCNRCYFHTVATWQRGPGGTCPSRSQLTKGRQNPGGAKILITDFFISCTTKLLLLRPLPFQFFDL